MVNGEKPEIRGLFLSEIKDILREKGEKPFRAIQVFQWIQKKCVQDWPEMKNISSNSRFIFEESFDLAPLKLLMEKKSVDDTRKYLWGLRDNTAIECVLLHHTGDRTKRRYTLCLSTQVGCAMGCGFCATGKLGYTRNLTGGEIVSQVLDVTNLHRRVDKDFKINNLVYMGMGEPLLNLPALVKSIRILNHGEGQNIGIRRITVSTCGIVPKIKELAHEALDIVLAISLHAPNDRLRNEIMPVNSQYPLKELISACDYYVKNSGRRITFEYALVKGFNDSKEQARELAFLIGNLPAHVNLIPVNSGPNSSYNRPGHPEIKSFLFTLQQLGINAVIREEKGSDIEAACGQLAGKYQETE